MHERLWIRCVVRDEEGLPVRHGPSRTYAVERAGGGVSYPRIALFEYRRGIWHGVHREWTREGDLILEESFVDGDLEGESRTWSHAGALLELRTYRDGRLHGPRRGWYASGEERWSAVYADGELVSFEGDRTVAGEPCPDATVPVTSPDGSVEFCERRSGQSGRRHGAYVVWGPDGTVVERGTYRHGKKAEVWEAPADAPPPPDELAGVLVAEGWLLVGEEELSAVTAVEPRYWFRDLGARDFVHPESELEGSRVRVGGLPPGEYSLLVRVDADRSNPEYYPGDFGGFGNFVVEKGHVARFEVSLQHILHLTEPIDNGDAIRAMALPCAEQPTFPAPVRFAWQPPGTDAPDIEYHYLVQRIACDPYRPRGDVASGSTRETAVELQLPPSRSGEVYTFALRATTAGEPLGYLTSHGPRGSYGWTVKFRVAGG